MSEAAYAVVSLNFACIGMLPRVFFRRDGRLNGAWWLTATPIIASFALVSADLLEIAHAITGRHLLPLEGIEVVAAVLSAASIGLIGLTLGTHRAPVSLWHQERNLPERLVTDGAYALIRHPFYASFLLTLTAGFLLSPQVGTLITLSIGLALLNYTAAKEERQLSESAMGADYRAYIRRTGRFWPPLRGRS
jgi:protein-S-isoprenylcysteine O-methyltransferase Ste14